ncbi:MAG: hypothetical protein Q8M19_10545 [Reyranella sp.]|nr:hypothetical protein [Reyranella sp.]
MSQILPQLSADFLPQLLAGMVVNFEIAAIALVIGLALGALLALARLAGGVTSGIAASVIGLMRAAPTFVVMFFLLNIIPRNATLFGLGVAPSALMTVALSLVPYSASYVADNGAEALQQLRRGSRLGALLFLPNVTRAFFVLVMSSSAGAAIGVTEGIAVILREAELLPALGDKLVLFAIGIVFFGVTLQVGFALVRLLQRRLGRWATSA